MAQTAGPALHTVEVSDDNDWEWPEKKSITENGSASDNPEDEVDEVGEANDEDPWPGEPLCQGPPIMPLLTGGESRRFPQASHLLTSTALLALQGLR